MPDDQPKKRSVSDISHLFLSNVRDLAGHGMPRPQRTPPGGVPPAPAPARSVDLTPEEYAHVFGADDGSAAGPDGTDAGTDERSPVAPVTAVLAAHLGPRQLERAREYARHVAGAAGARVGLIELDVSEFRLFRFDPAAEPGTGEESRSAAATGACDPREVAEAIEELNADVDRWLVLVPNLRTPEAKALVRAAERWALLATCDHDGVVAAYRTLKTVGEARVTAGPAATALGLAVLDAAGDAEAARVQQKLAGVCRQFLDWGVAPESPVRFAAGVAEHALMNCRVSRDKAQLASAAHWGVVTDLLARPRRGRGDAVAVDGAKSHAASAGRPIEGESTDSNPFNDARADVRRIVLADASAVEDSDLNPAPEEAPASAPKPVRAAPDTVAPPAPPARQTDEAPATLRITPSHLGPAAFARGPGRPADDVVELPGDPTDARGILSAVLRRPEWGLVECPLTPPACPAARLAVARDRGIVLVAVATRGLAELRAVGLAYRWLAENLNLIALALPQFAIDAGRTPGLQLLVDQTDLSADLLRPIVQAEHVTVRAYRTLRWAGRTGLLLDAA